MNSNMTEQLDQLFRMWDRGLCWRSGIDSPAR